ncbi:MAG: serine--tRNA ligase, partial [Chloroflexi bacterium]|nr:serine--tRNA ligase [Chloroflexota bacterium]
MLSIQLIREQPDMVRQALVRRDEDPSPLDRVLDLDKRRRTLLAESESLRARRNEVSKQLGKMKDKPPETIAEMREVGSSIKALETDLKQVDADLTDLLLTLPNIPLDDVPVGEDESGNVLIKTHGEPLTFDFTPLPHWELGESLGILDFERGVKISGSRFYVLKGPGARLQRALITWMLDLHVQQHGYQEVYLPFMVKKESMVASGNLPKFGDNLYHDAEDDLWFIPTAEVPLTNLHRDEIFPPGALPINYVAYTPCFRREKMSAGRDTRGIKRGHQFDKVEMYKFVEPHTSEDELQRLVSDAEEVAQGLGLAYR